MDFEYRDVRRLHCASSSRSAAGSLVNLVDNPAVGCAETIKAKAEHAVIRCVAPFYLTAKNSLPDQNAHSVVRAAIAADGTKQRRSQAINGTACFVNRKGVPGNLAWSKNGDWVLESTANWTSQSDDGTRP
jgi:hypothetical protein